MAKSFSELKEWAIKHLESQLNTDVKKSFSMLVAEIMEKSVYPVGTIREWKGKKYKKTAPGKWQRYYDGASRGMNTAIKNAIRKIQNCNDIHELAKIINQNRSRFMNSYGQLLPEAAEILKQGKSKGSEFAAARKQNESVTDTKNEESVEENSKDERTNYLKNHISDKVDEYMKDAYTKSSAERFIRRYGESRLYKIAERKLKAPDEYKEWLNTRIAELEEKGETISDYTIDTAIWKHCVALFETEAARKKLQSLQKTSETDNDTAVPVSEEARKEANRIIGSDISSLMDPDYRWSKSTARATLADKIRRRARNEPEVCRAMFHLIREADPEKKNIFTARNSIWEVENQLNEKAEQKKAAGEEETATGTKELYANDDGISIVENKDIGRYQIMFPGRPDRETISKLKHNGWHWSPSNGAWQRQNTANGEYSMKRMAEELGLNVKKSFTEQVMEIMEKGKAATLGEVRTWKDGKKYRKEVGGWKEVLEGRKESKKTYKKKVKGTSHDDDTYSGSTHTEGDIILFKNDKGKQLNGTVKAVGKDGVTVEDSKGE